MSDLVMDDHQQQGVLNVKTPVSRAVCMAFSLAILASTPALVCGQNGPPGTRVAVIDISAIFKQHPGFKQAMETMKVEVTSFENQLRARGEEMQKLQEQMQEFKPTSAEYKQLEARILKLQADGQAAAAIKKKEFLERESKIYYATYQEIQAEVARFAEQYGIGLVVRFNSEDIDQDQRNSILEGVNRAVVYQKNLNITDAVLERIVRRSTATNPPATTPR